MPVIKDRLVHHVSPPAWGYVLLIAVILLVSQGVFAAADRDQWQEEILLQLSELRKGQGELRKQVTDLTAQVQALESAGKPAPISMDLRNKAYPVMGKATSTVAIVEFADFECPYCRRHQQQTMPVLVEKYIDTGKLRYLFMNFPLAFHARAEPTALAGVCAHRQGAFWAMREGLFKKQAALDQPMFLQLATELGLDSARFAACLEDPSVTAQVRAEVKLGESLGVQGTPAFVLGRVRDGVLTDATLITGAQPLATFERAIDGLLAEAAAARR